MSKTTKAKMVESMREELSATVTRYCRNKKELDTLTDKVEQDKARIKELMNLIDETSFEANGFQVNIVIQNKESLNESDLIEFMKENLDKKSCNKVIKIKHVIDKKELDLLIKNGNICNAQIDPFKTITTATRLTMKEVEV